MVNLINIQAVKVPNPLALKFAVEGADFSRTGLTFKRGEDTSNSPLAEILFQFQFIDNVFIAFDFITVSLLEENNPSWQEVMGQVRIVIKKHIEMGGAVLVNKPDFVSSIQEKDEPTVRALKEMMEMQVLPATRHDGGEMTFHSFDGKQLKVSLAGACVRCPFAPRTIKAGIQKLVQSQFPDIEVTSDDVDWANTQQEEHAE